MNKKVNKAILIILAMASFWACKRELTYRFPVSDHAKTWVPKNQDSVLFLFHSTLQIASKDTQYLIYDGYSSTFSNDETSLEIITQNARATVGGFQVNYTLQSGIPGPNQQNAPTKTDVLSIKHNGTTNDIFISNTSTSGSFYLLDTLVINNRTFTDVLTDSSGYFFTQAQGIIYFNSGNNWYYKAN